MTIHRDALLNRLTTTAEIMGSKLSDNALAVMASDLQRFPADEVAMALNRVRHECRGRLTLPEILERIPSWKKSRPLTADEAWNEAIASRLWDEDATIRVSKATFHAFPLDLWHEGDKIGARRTFIDRYNRESAKPDAHEPYQSLGLNVKDRRAALEIDRRGLAVLEHLSGKEPPTDAEEAPAGDDEGSRQKTAKLIGETVAQMKRDLRRTDLEQREPAPEYQEGEPLPSDPP